MTEAEGLAGAFRPVLDALHSGCRGYFGVPDIALTPSVPSARRFSTVLRVHVQSAAGCSHVFVKIHKPQRDGIEEQERLRSRVVTEFSTTARVRAHFAGHPGLSAAYPVAVFPEHLAIVMEEVPGETLLRLMARCASWRPAPRTLDRLCLVAHQVGRWLKVFQELEKPRGPLSLDGMREYIDTRLKMLVDSSRAEFSEAHRLAILRVFDEQSAAVTGEQLEEVVTHADLSLSNVLVDGADVAVIDFGEPKFDARHHDLAHVFMQLELLGAKPHFSAATIECLQAALVSGFDRTLDPSQPMFLLLRLKHVLCHYATLATRPAPPAERIYNWYLQKRHQNWLNSLIDESRRPWTQVPTSEASGQRVAWR